MNSPHAVVVWIDHKEARIFHVEADTFDESTLHASHHIDRHPKSKTSDRSHLEEEHRFFEAVSQALHGANQVLVLGPSTAKLSFINHVHRHEHALEPRIVGVETVDHPTDRQLVAYARHYFLQDPPRELPLPRGR